MVSIKKISYNFYVDPFDCTTVVVNWKPGPVNRLATLVSRLYSFQPIVLSGSAIVV